MKDLLTSFRWQDILDIVIITFIFYRLYLWLRRKRALRMIIALLALPFFYLVAQWFDLPLTVWGFKNLWAVILFVVIVIFQQEIRTALASITLPSFVLGKSEIEKLTSKHLDQIVEAAYKLGEKRIGGLIVLQRRDDLDEFVHGNMRLDSEISEDLLISIFNPLSPLHDGAVIIQGERIQYATALLPVSQSPTLPKDWGTRHRAGIGITEVSDAECIIISEERGDVLLAHLAKAQKMEKKEDLKKGLSQLPSFPKEKPWEKDRLRHLLDDVPKKLFFLLLVCILWVFVVGIRQGEITYDIPIEYYSIPQSLGMMGDPPREINVRLRGSQRFLSSLNPDQIRVRVDLSRTHTGNNQVSLSESDMNVPSGITVTHFYPRKINIQLTEQGRTNMKR
ncbi:MAG: diadenylate cyclase CdaA [Deltaproteobacteria bacterium]